MMDSDFCRSVFFISRWWHGILVCPMNKSQPSTENLDEATHTPQSIYTREYSCFTNDHYWMTLWIKPDVSQNPLFNSKQSHSHTSPPRMPFHSVNQMLIFDIMLRLVWCSVMARGRVTPIFTSLLYREGYDNSLLNEHGLFRSNPQMILLPHILVAIPTVHSAVAI